MEQLWSPWRSKYIGSFKDKDKIEECFICHAKENEEVDENNLLVAKFNNVLVLMNKYPYNNGHLLVSPLVHKGELDDLNDEVRVELMNVLNISTKVIKEVYNPQGYNIGLNAGASAGAGLPDHLHFHIVPRWRGDTNFTAVTSDFKVMNESMEDSKKNLADEFKKYTL